MNATHTALFGHSVIVGLALAAVMAAPSAGAEDMTEVNGDRLIYSRCYSAASPLPNPALAYGQDVCLEYSVSRWEHVWTVPGSVAPDDVSWTVSESGEAIVTSLQGASK